MNENHELQLALDASKDLNAFTELYDLYVNQIYRFFIGRLNVREQAEDLTSIVWEKILKNIGKFTPQKHYSFRAWIFLIARNTLIDFYRQNKKLQYLELNDNIHLKDEKTNHLEALKQKEEMATLRLLINGLPEQQSQIIAFHFFSDLNNREIAKIMDISEKTVSSHLCRGLKVIYERLKSIT